MILFPLNLYYFGLRTTILLFNNGFSLYDKIGAEVLGDLSSQRETISRARDRLREADSDLNRSHKVLSQMIRRVIQNRLLLLVIAVLLLFSLVFIIYRSL
ncbi:Vesicle transport through interaction with t-SNAREs -like protein 1A [Toxocara canis]|uniref:Vesicle transport through interaction with t-SNAREs-like protein 1A n=1 Tax=Toxocara canis TaxID=6265 RepID=A0A0B2VW64_TOXCA|nr:Vesicle transport through interaction with t-SNAREs -like protein 1A [Toxocara canis]